MMEKRPSISVSQMFAMLFISRMVVSMTYGTLLIGDSYIWDHVISAAISFVLAGVLVIPVYILFSMDKKMNVMDNLRDLAGKFGYIFIVFYIVYYLITGAHTLSVFNNFIFNAVNPPISISLLSWSIIASACYGASKGLEALARTSGFILVSTVFSLIFLGISLFSGIESINFTPLMYDGSESVIEGVLYMLGQNSCLPALCVLLPMARGNKKLGFLFWDLSVYVFTALIIVLITGTMGDFAGTQLFPVYTAAGIGKFGAFQHLDSLYLGIWMSGIFLKLSLFIMLAGEGVKKILGEKARKISVIVFGVLLGVLSMFSENLKFSPGIFKTEFLLVFLIVVTLCVPSVLIIFKSIKKRSAVIEG